MNRDDYRNYYKPIILREIYSETPELAEEHLSILNEKDAYVLKRRLGILGEQFGTLKAIGIELGVKQERIRQREARALRTIRAYLKNKEL